MKPFTFEAEAKYIEQDGLTIVAAWTDGVSLCCDNGNVPWDSLGADFCAFKMKPGRKYKITIQEVKQ